MVLSQVSSQSGPMPKGKSKVTSPHLFGQPAAGVIEGALSPVLPSCLLATPEASAAGVVSSAANRQCTEIMAPTAYRIAAAGILGGRCTVYQCWLAMLTVWAFTNLHIYKSRSNDHACLRASGAVIERPAGI